MEKIEIVFNITNKELAPSYGILSTFVFQYVLKLQTDKFVKWKHKNKIKISVKREKKIRQIPVRQNFNSDINRFRKQKIINSNTVYWSAMVVRFSLNFPTFLRENRR